MGSFSIWHWLIVLLLVVFIYINYRYCKSYKLLLLELDASVKPFNGNTAFLLFIPIFNLIWQVVLLIHIRNAIRTMKEKGLTSTTADGGFIFGLIFVILSVLSALMIEEQLSFILLFVGFCCGIVTWIKVVSTRKELEKKV